jgi:hypothetical protein
LCEEEEEAELAETGVLGGEARDDEDVVSAP